MWGIGSTGSVTTAAAALGLVGSLTVMIAPCHNPHLCHAPTPTLTPTSPWLPTPTPSPVPILPLKPTPRQQYYDFGWIGALGVEQKTISWLFLVIVNSGQFQVNLEELSGVHINTNKGRDFAFFA